MKIFFYFARCWRRGTQAHKQNTNHTKLKKNTYIHIKRTRLSNIEPRQHIGDLAYECPLTELLKLIHFLFFVLFHHHHHHHRSGTLGTQVEEGDPGRRRTCQSSCRQSREEEEGEEGAQGQEQECDASARHHQAVR